MALRAPVKIPMQSVVWQSLTVASINVYGIDYCSI